MELNFKVGFRTSEDIPHGIKKHYRIVAAFENSANAEDFIKNCIQKENQNRFFIEVNNRRFYPLTFETEGIN